MLITQYRRQGVRLPALVMASRQPGLQQEEQELQLRRAGLRPRCGPSHRRPLRMVLMWCMIAQMVISPVRAGVLCVAMMAIAVA